MENPKLEPGFPATLFLDYLFRMSGIQKQFASRKSGTATSKGSAMEPADDNKARAGFGSLYPVFFELVRDFPDFYVQTGLDEDELAALEKKLDFRFPDELREFLRHFSAVAMNGLTIRADQLGPIVMPSSEAIVIGEFYLNNPGDRLLMLPEDSSIYYLENRNGAITKLAANMSDFFEKTLPKYL